MKLIGFDIIVSGGPDNQIITRTYINPEYIKCIRSINQKAIIELDGGNQMVVKDMTAEEVINELTEVLWPRPAFFYDHRLDKIK